MATLQYDKCTADIAAPTAGVLQLPPRHTIGYLGHEPLVYRELTPLENLRLFARLYGVERKEERIGSLLQRFGLWDARTERVSTFAPRMVASTCTCRPTTPRPWRRAL